jgi:transposase
MAGELTEQQKAQIVQGVSAGDSYRKVARDVGCSDRTVRSIWNKWQLYGSTTHRPGAGRPHTLSDEDHKALAKIIKNNPTATAKTLKDKLEQKTGTVVTERTMDRERHELGFHPVHSQKRPLLTSVHEEKRLDFAKTNINTDWKYVVFDDESHFSSTQHGVVYWIRKGEHPPYEQVSQIKYHCNVWAAFYWQDKFPLEIYSHTLSSDTYTQILANNLIPNYPVRTTNRLYYLAHDNATPHVARNTVNFLADNNILTLPDWPPNTPELNPVEKAWAWMKNYITKLKPQSQHALEDAIQQAWDAIPQSTIQNWITHCKSVCQQLIANKGSTISE